MPSIGPLELGIILLIVLIVFGPKRLITGKDKDDDEDRDAFGEPTGRATRARLDASADEAEVVTGEARREDQPASRRDS
jgi:Sec-independent protein translocase protein TatA